MVSGSRKYLPRQQRGEVRIPNRTKYADDTVSRPAACTEPGSEMSSLPIPDLSDRPYKERP
jgi:hypothetical protein